MAEKTKAAPEAFRELTMKPEVRTAFQKFGVDIGKVEAVEKKVEKAAEQVQDKHDSIKRFITTNEDRFARDHERYTNVYMNQKDEFQKSIADLSTKKSFLPDQTIALNTQKERHVQERNLLEVDQLTNQSLLQEESIKMLNQFDIESAHKAMRLSAATQERMDVFIVDAEKKLAAAKPEEREKVNESIRKDATNLLTSVADETGAFLMSVKKDQTRLNSEIKDTLADSLNGFKKNYDQLLDEHSREDSKMLATLKVDRPFDTLSHDEKMAFCDPAEIRARMDRTLDRVSTTPGEFAMVSQAQVNKNDLTEVAGNAHLELDRFKTELAPDSFKMCSDFIDKMGGTLNKALEAGELNGVKGNDLDGVMRDSIQKLVFQETESRKRQLGDHGVRHILGNVDSQEKVFDALDTGGLGVTPKERFLAAVVQVNHDMGYVSEISIFKSDKYHKQYGGKIFDAEKDKFGSVFTPTELSFMKNAVETHDDATINWKVDPVNSAIRMADNMALFAPQKLPALFKEVPGSLDVLAEMKIAATSHDTDTFAMLKETLAGMIERSNLSHQMMRDLMWAAGEVNERSADFTLGMLAGDIGEVKFDRAKECINVAINYDSTHSLLQDLGFFDMERKQFQKFAKSLNVPLADPNQTVFDMKDAVGKTLVHVEVVNIVTGVGTAPAPTPVAA